MWLLQPLYFSNIIKRCLLLLLLLLQDRSLLGADPVIWLTFGVTHFVRPEDAPVMPCDQVRTLQCMLRRLLLLLPVPLSSGPVTRCAK
jgi:hypothetical protein